MIEHITLNFKWLSQQKYNFDILGWLVGHLGFMAYQPL